MRSFRYFAMVLLALALAGCVTGPGAKHPGTPAQWREAMQPPLDPAQAKSLAEEITLSRAITAAVERNPGAAAARRRWLAAIKVEPQAGTPPDPMLQAGYQFENVKTRVGPQIRNFGLTQPLPWPQKLWAKSRVAATNADIAQLQYESVIRDLIVDVKDACYELYYLDQALPITKRVEEMLGNDAVLAYSELTVGRTQLNEAFRAESQAAQLAYDRILLEEQRAAQAERLRSLLNLPPETAIGPVRTAPVYEVSSSIGDLYARAEAYAQVLKIRGLETQRAAYQTFLAKLARVPDVSVGFNYIETDQSRVTNAMRRNYTAGVQAFGSGASTKLPSPLRPSDSGKDPIIGLFSMNLPIFEWRNRAVIQEQRALEEAMQFDALASLNQVRAAAAQACFRVRLTQRLVKLYDETLLPQAEAVMQQAEVYFRNDQASFSNLLETTIAYHNFSLARLRAAADHGQAIGQLERVLGTTGEPRPEASEEAPAGEENSAK